MACSLVTRETKEHGHGRASSPWFSFFASYYSVNIQIVLETCMIFNCMYMWVIAFFSASSKRLVRSK